MTLIYTREELIEKIAKLYLHQIKDNLSERISIDQEAVNFAEEIIGLIEHYDNKEE